MILSIEDYDRAEHAAYMREWRKKHKPSREQAARDIARSYAGVYKRRGYLIQEPCIVCGDPKTEMHHPDYNKPLNVKWMCRDHHMELEAIKRSVGRRP